MNLKLSRKSISFIEPLAKISAIFGIVPFYNFQTHSLKNIKLFKFYSLLLACLLPVLSINLLRLRIGLFIGGSKNFIVLDLLLESASLISFEITVLGSSLWNLENWQKLFQCLHQIEDKDNLDVKQKESKEVLINPNFLALVGSVALILLWYSELYYNRQQYFSYTYLALFFFFYVEFLCVNIISNIALCIKHKYEAINNLFSNILLYTNNTEKTVKSLRKIKSLLLATDNIVAIFNKLFGLPILFMPAVAVLVILNFMVMASGISLKFNGADYPVTVEFILINLGYTVAAGVSDIFFK